MDKTALIRKLETILDDAKRTAQWGTIEIVLQSGEPITLHETRTTKLRGEGKTHGQRFESR